VTYCQSIPKFEGLEHKGVQLPAVINSAHYTHGAGRVRSNVFVNNLWQYREFKTDINAKGESIFARLRKNLSLSLSLLFLW
jgi:hypothetical protein